MPFKDIEFLVKNNPTPKNSSTDGFTGKFYQTFQKEILILYELFQKIKYEEILSNSFYKASIALTPKPKILQKQKTAGQFSSKTQTQIF